jgi:hypothetical protein
VLNLLVIGGVVTAVVQLSKDVAVGRAATTAVTATTPAAYMTSAATGAPVRVLATTSLTVVESIKATDSDESFDALHTVTFGALTLQVAGWARTNAGVYLLTHSPAVPVVLMSANGFFGVVTNVTAAVNDMTMYGVVKSSARQLAAQVRGKKL